MSESPSSRSAGGEPPFQLSQDFVTAQGAPSADRPPEMPAPAYEHLGELPSTYGSQSAYLVAYDPKQLFAYWDIDWGAEPGGLTLRVHRGDGEIESQSELNPAEPGRYVAVGQPGGAYFVEIGKIGRDGQWRALAQSGRVQMPPEGVANDLDARFATLPFHLSFQRLVDVVRDAMAPGEDLTTALARLQRRGGFGATSLLSALGSLSAEQLKTLKLLLGEELSMGGEWTPSESGSRTANWNAASGSSETFSSPVGGLRGEDLSSPSSSTTRWAAGAQGSEALSSGQFGARGAGASESLSSERFAAAGAGGSESLNSAELLARQSFGSEAVTSFGLSSESLSSLRTPLSSEAYTAAMARGSELLSSGAWSPRGAGASEAWRLASLGFGADSGSFSSEQAIFLHAVETNLNRLGSLFSQVESGLSSEFGSSSHSLASRGNW